MSVRQLKMDQVEHCLIRQFANRILSKRNRTLLEWHASQRPVSADVVNRIFSCLPRIALVHKQPKTARSLGYFLGSNCTDLLASFAELQRTPRRSNTPHVSCLLVHIPGAPLLAMHDGVHLQPTQLPTIHVSTISGPIVIETAESFTMRCLVGAAERLSVYRTRNRHFAQNRALTRFSLQTNSTFTSNSHAN